MDDKEIDRLLNSKEPNKPAKIPKTRTPLTRPRVDVKEQRKRREVLSALLIQGTSDDVIFELMGREFDEEGNPGFNMSRVAVQELKREVFADWDDQDAERKPYDKTMAVKRILRHIKKASSNKAWTSVAMLEKNLSMIQGTAEAIEVNTTHELRISEAVLAVLGEKDPRDLRALIESERQRMLEEERTKPIAVLPDGNKVYDKDDG
jgi:hypothetical protein